MRRPNRRGQGRIRRRLAMDHERCGEGGDCFCCAMVPGSFIEAFNPKANGNRTVPSLEIVRNRTRSASAMPLP